MDLSLVASCSCGRCCVRCGSTYHQRKSESVCTCMHNLHNFTHMDVQCSILTQQQSLFKIVMEHGQNSL